MPYFIRKDSPGCDGWAVVKTDGAEVACQDTKTMAIKQMVALSLAEGIEPGGDWADMEKD